MMQNRYHKDAKRRVRSYDSSSALNRYNALNRPVTYTRENANGTLTVITADYDYMGRRVFKKVETVTPAAPDSETGEDTRTVLTHHRFLYRGYLQIAALDLTRSTLNDLWLITWDPTQPVATRPLAIQKDGTWYTYGLDLPKNSTEVYGFDGYIKTTYTYSPYGQVTASGNTSQPLQWSSEFTDTDLGLVYYNYRHYNPLDGRWTGRDPAAFHLNIHLYCYLDNRSEHFWDYLGLVSSLHAGVVEGLTAGTISVEDAIALLGGVAALTTLLQSRGRRLRCKACIPAVGTMMEQEHTTHKHAGMCPHFHIFKVNQSPIDKGCKCFAPKDRKGFSKSQGYMSYVQPIGGGIEIV